MGQPQNPSSPATLPDYGVLKRAPAHTDPSDLTIDQALDGALPGNFSDPVFKALRDLVRAFMARKDEHGLIMKPCTAQAMVGVQQAINANPQLANAEVVKSVAFSALHDGEFTQLGGDVIRMRRPGGDIFPGGRAAAVMVLGTIAEKRPDLIDPTLINAVETAGASDPDSSVRGAAQDALAKIVNKRPDVIDADMIKVVSQTATPTAGAAVKRNTETLMGWPEEITDNNARATAQQTLKTMKDTRPDLFTEPKQTNRPKLQTPLHQP